MTWLTSHRCQFGRRSRLVHAHESRPLASWQAGSVQHNMKPGTLSTLISMAIVICMSGAQSGCISFSRSGSYHWRAYVVGDGLLVNCSIHDVGSRAGDKKWQSDLAERCRQAVLADLRGQGISVDDSAVLSFSEARGWPVVGIVTGNAAFVRHAVDMGSGFWPTVDYKRTINKGHGVISP